MGRHDSPYDPRRSILHVGFATQDVVRRSSYWSASDAVYWIENTLAASDPTCDAVDEALR